MDYPDRWKQRLPDEDERRRRGQEHWRPSWAMIVALVIAAVAFAVAFWPGGSGSGG